MTTLCIKAIVSGKVQGVFYRNNTRKKALSLNITGWVKNNSDQTVELMACGEHDHINQLIEWLWKGPDRARVTNVAWMEIPSERQNGFIIVR